MNRPYVAGANRATHPVGFEFTRTITRSFRHGCWWPDGVSSRSVVWRVIGLDEQGRECWARVRIEQVRDGRTETLWVNPRLLGTTDPTAG